jgi:hypothetical protein
MKLLSFGLGIISLLTITTSCKQIKTSTLNYKSLNYDTNKVAIFQWDTTKYVFPNNSDPLPLSQSDLYIVDSLLKNAIDSFNSSTAQALYLSFDKVHPVDSFTINPTRYKTQFFPYKDVNGQRIMLIIGFSDNFDAWLTQVYESRLDHYGITKSMLKVNLSEKSRENIIPGSYG